MSDELNLDTTIESSEPTFDLSDAIDSISLGLGETTPEPQVIKEEPAPEPAPKAEGGENLPEEPKAEGGIEALGAPSTWRKDAKEAWAGLPPLVQAEVLKREEDMLKGITGYKAQAEIGQTFEKLVTPHLPALQYHQINPVQLVNDLLGMHHQLLTGTPETKTQLFAKLAEMFNVDPLSAAESYTPAYVDPSIKALQDEINTLKLSRQQEEQAQQAQTSKAIEAEISSFAADPANIYFDDVIEDMEKLLQSGVATDIKTAYTKAVRLNDSVQAKEAIRAQAEKAKLEADKVAKAKSATSTNLRTNAKSVTSTSPLGSMEDTMRATLLDIKSRTN